MRLSTIAITCAAACTLAAEAPPPQPPKADAAAAAAAEATLAATRTALGGEKKLTAVKTLLATGRTRQVRGDNLVPIEFEIAIELPDRYVRKDEIPAQESEPTTVGFNGAELIQLPVPSLTGRGGQPTPPAALEAARAARLASARQDFARLTLGLFAVSFDSFPLTFSYAAKAEAPQGKADVIDVKGPNNFTARLFISADTHLPIMIAWTPPAPQRGGPARGDAPARGATPPPAPPEARIYYGDYRDANGLTWPFRLRRAVGADTVEETTFDGFKINPKIDPKKFEVKK